MITQQWQKMALTTGFQYFEEYLLSTASSCQDLCLDPLLCLAFLGDSDNCPISLDSCYLIIWLPLGFTLGTVCVWDSPWIYTSSFSQLCNFLLLSTLVLGTLAQHLPLKILDIFFPPFCLYSFWYFCLFFTLTLFSAPFPSFFEAHIFSLNNHFSFPRDLYNLAWKLTFL